MKTSSARLSQQNKFQQDYEYRLNHGFQVNRNKRSRFVASMLCLTGIGAVYQYIAAASDRAKLPPPGTLVNADGCRLHLQSAGSGTPTVVLEAGLGSMSSAWAWVQSETAKFCHVVSYDRTGLGWSESDKSPKSAMQTSLKLRALLHAANAPPPYILVGHSMGGLLIRVFADLFPMEVAGLVLVDASHPDQITRSSSIGNHMRSGFRMLSNVPLLTAVGYIRLTGFFNSWAAGLPEKQVAEAEAFLTSYRHLKTTRDESLAWDAICDEVRRTRNLGNKQLAVVTAGKDVLPGQPELQGELSSLSSNSFHVVVKGADHVTLVTHRQYALSVVEAIRNVVQTSSIRPAG